MGYISSNDNRFYVALEESYGRAAAATSLNRIPAVKLTTKQARALVQRQDKTGTRTFLGNPPGGRRTTSFELETYMRDWADQSKEPGYGPLFQAGLGSAAAMATPPAAAAGTSGSQITFAGAHGLQPGQAVTFGSEMRFVTAIVNANSVQLNAPFSVTPAAGASIGTTATYMPGDEMSSATILDYWSPVSAVQRALYGAAVNVIEIQINGDVQRFRFAGNACDILDTSSFQQGEASLDGFPQEPDTSSFNYSIVPGHLGQVWLGSSPEQFFTLTSAAVKINNNADLRDKEFGSNLARGISAGTRTVTVDFSVYGQDDAQTKALYQAARQDSPVSVMLQLGQQAGQLAGIYMKGVMLETPSFDDSDKRQQWTFQNARAQGTGNDEISIAFG